MDLVKFTDPMTAVLSRLPNPVRHLAPPKRDGNYTYEALDSSKKEIRLLKIFPRRLVGGIDQGIECRLIIMSLDDHDLNYEALSYTWGDQLDPRDISIDGQAFQAGRNLHSTLYHLRSESEPRTFWIDALCIDQRNLIERSEQVSKMISIYRTANHIVIWLGHDYENSGLAFALLNRLGSHIHDDPYVARILQNPSSGESLKAVVDLFSRPYWFRVWVIQEVNSNQNMRITVTCGIHSIDWKILGEIQNILRQDHWDLLVRTSAREERLKYLYVRILSGGWKALQLPDIYLSETPDLYTLLSLFLNQEATDPKDRVYALAGLSTAQKDSRFVVDYSVSIQQAYINATTYIMVSSRKLDVICSMPRSLSEFDLPSWVVDWTALDAEPSFPCIEIARFFKPNKIPLFCAAGTSTAAIEFKDDDKVLIAHGFRLGHVGSVGTKCRENPYFNKEAGIAALLDWFNLLGSTGEVTATKASAFCKTIMFDLLPIDEKFETTIHLVETMLGLLATSAEEHCPNEVIHPYLLDMKEKSKPTAVSNSSWFDNALFVVALRRFFISSADLMGMAPDSAEPGDLICILLGCYMPVILRPTDGHYVLLGGAYYEDYMYGKGMEELAEGKFKLETFDIH